MTPRLFLFEPEKIHAKFDFVLHQHYGKKQRKRNHLQLVNKGVLLARRANASVSSYYLLERRKECFIKSLGYF